MFKKLANNSIRPLVYLTLFIVAFFLVKDFMLYSKKQRNNNEFDFIVFGNKFIPTETIKLKASNNNNYDNTYDLLINDLKIISGSENQKIVIVEEKIPIFFDHENIYISHNQYIDKNKYLNNIDQLPYISLEIKDELKYNTALKKIEMIIDELNSSNNKFYEALELIEYDENKFLKLKINSCAIKLIKIDKNFTSIMRKDIKEKFNSLEFFMNIENKEIAEISEIDLRWNNEGYIIWEDKF
tara:strand:+ start:1424 stop:2146 length:723 start_codon:yes stop_codon:yes gene_type:complete